MKKRLLLAAALCAAGTAVAQTQREHGAHEHGHGALNIVTLGVQGAAACAFHTYAPDPTVVDIMLGAERIVLARPGSDGRLEVVRSLMGASDTVELDVELDFPTRGRLAGNPDAAVLLVRGYDYGPWQMIAYAGPGYQSVLADVVSYLPAWSVGGDESRLQMFADLLDHPDPDVRTLALKELDLADYSLLRDLDLSHAPALDAVTGGDEDLRPIRILLAGLTGQAEAAEVLEAALRDDIGKGLAYLGAYAIALLELRGPAAAESLADTYLRDPGLAIDAREKLLEAFAIQSRAGTEETGAAVRRLASAVLDDASELGPAVARQFGFQGDWSQAAALSRVVASHEFADIADVFALSQYIALSKEYDTQ